MNAKIMNIAFPVKISWQIGFGPTDDPLVVAADLIYEMPSVFRGDKLLVAEGFAPVALRVNGDLVKGDAGQPLDEAYFDDWRLRCLALGTVEDSYIFYLRRQGVYLSLKPGDHVELRAKWLGADQAERLFATLIGYVEKKQEAKTK